MQTEVMVAVITSGFAALAAGAAAWFTFRAKSIEVHHDGTTKVEIRRIDQADDIRKQLAALWSESEKRARECEARERALATQLVDLVNRKVSELETRLTGGVNTPAE